MKTAEIESIEVELFIQAINKRYEFDLTHYAPASLKRRILELPHKLNFPHLSDLTSSLLRDESLLDRVITHITVPVTEMFRDPEDFLCMTREIFPVLRTYPKLTIWVAGCATGEEVWSLAILLHEAKLLKHCQIYATDINRAALIQAERAIYPIDKIKQYSSAYFKAGGKTSLSQYFNILYDGARIIPEIRQYVKFDFHNLAIDQVFCSSQLILCRNVMIYFDCQLQNTVLNLFLSSLVRSGFLSISNNESLSCLENKGGESQFTNINKDFALFRKK